MSTAAIVVIGNEILSSKVQDENGPWLARELRSLGVDLRRIETVPDEIPLIVDALRRCLASAKWVFTSGGIGPTHDDVTIAAVSQAFGRRVVTDERTVELLRAHFRPPLKPALLRLAEVPEGSLVEFHEGFLFPVISLENVIVLPGVPSLLQEGFTRIRERFRVAPIFSRALYFSIGESTLAEHLDATVARFPTVGIGSYPRFDQGADYRVKVTFDGRDEAEVAAALEFLKARAPQGSIIREG
ncbi:MAG TPA: molybdopterin-binding protein [Myxococcales bacterium]|nr:molybdopterin-binding protein [Myxococcales bacterium]